MSIRPLKFPNDITVVQYLITTALVDPDAGWDVNQDEIQDVLRMLGFMKQAWDVLRIGRALSTSLHDTFLGYVWEIDHEPIGMIFIDRLPRTTTWQIGIVAVMPPFRQRGIGTRLVNAAVELAQQLGGSKIIFDVPGRSNRMRHICERLGFEIYDGLIEYEYAAPKPPPFATLPEGYTMYGLTYFNARQRYDLAQRIVPSLTQEFEPLRPKDFRRPYIPHLLRRISLKLQGVTEAEFGIFTTLDAQIVARGGSVIRGQWGEVSEIAARVDSQYADVMPFLVYRLVEDARKRSRRRRVEMIVPIWQQLLIDYVETIGFEKIEVFYKMGLRLSQQSRSVVERDFKGKRG